VVAGAGTQWVMSRHSSRARCHSYHGVVGMLTGTHRDPSMPDVPTFTEAGLAGADVTSVWGLHAPPGTPIEIRRTVRDAIAEALRDPALAKKLAEFGYEPIANTPEEHQAQTAALVRQWIEVGKTVNLKE